MSGGLADAVGMQLEEIQKCAMDIPDGDRARLAADLLGSLPAMLVEADD